MKSERQSLLFPDSSEVPEYNATPQSVGEFREMVLAYYHRHSRDLPWRRTTDPYSVLVSEIMLQQTQVERVAQKYPQFIEAFPDFSSLAVAPLPDLLAVWQGMGYNRRALSLNGCAVRVMEEYGGELPPDPDILATFPGIGRATASSICAFAFNMPAVFIETNIRRVFIHYFFRDCAIVTDKEIVPLVEQALYRENPRQWYNALMDLGTDLKKQVPNPNRRSAAYSRQPAFEGSDRKIRGNIIRILLKHPEISQEDIVRLTDSEPERIMRILRDLETDGFLIHDPDGVRLCAGKVPHQKNPVE